MGVAESEKSDTGRWRVLTLSTIAFTMLFGVWLMLGVLNIPMKKSLGLSDGQVEWLIAAAILAGATTLIAWMSERGCLPESP